MSVERMTKKFLISGRVQGVGFRWFTKRIADTIGVKGFVRNLHDGRVETVASGTPAQLKDFYLEVSKGPSYSAVTEVQEYEITGGRTFDRFDITF